MSVKISIKELQDQLPELLDRVAEGAEEYVIERNGKDAAVIVSMRQWRRREAARRLDALGPKYRLTRAEQTRVETILAAGPRRSLTQAERCELDELRRECDAVLARRTDGMEEVL